MAADATLVSKLKSLIAEDPRTAVLLLEILGPPLGLTSPARGSRSDEATSDT